jgi:formylglycine-generating enzyme required for sulfatase activity
VQCIRELRQKVGDDDHKLIKTVSRRGYLLDAAVSTDAIQHLADGSAAVPPEARTRLGLPQPLGAVRLPNLRAWITAPAALLCAAWFAAYLTGWPVRPGNPAYFSLAKQLPGDLQRRPTFKDCSNCPEMVALPAGEFMMGLPENERGHAGAEGLPRRVVVPKPIAIGKFEVTVEQFSAFDAETGMTVGNFCKVIVAFDHTPIAWGRAEASFRQPGFEVIGSHPVVCVSWHDAQAYVAWLRHRTGKPYRLPTEAEWEYAARAGTSTSYSFGNDASALCAYARFADLGSRFSWSDGCRSDVATYGPLPVGSLQPNPWGLFDMHGNVWEWVEDCWTPNPFEIPTNGSAFSRPGNCDLGVVRGGSFAAPSRRIRSAVRAPVRTTTQAFSHGFRVAVSLGD